MDTKWKRSKKVISMLVWALGVSALAVCAVANPVRVCGGLIFTSTFCDVVLCP